MKQLSQTFDSTAYWDSQPYLAQDWQKKRRAWWEFVVPKQNPHWAYLFVPQVSVGPIAPNSHPMRRSPSWRWCPALRIGEGRWSWTGCTLYRTRLVSFFFRTVLVRREQISIWNFKCSVEFHHSVKSNEMENIWSSSNSEGWKKTSIIVSKIERSKLSKNLTIWVTFQ